MKRAPHIKGWCPGALRPMMSGDGLVVRVRPFGGRFGVMQAKGIADLAQVHGSGVLDVSSRGNLQIRGVAENDYAALIDGLRDLDLIDPSAESEQRRNILVHPYWDAGDETQHLVTGLQAALAQADAPDLPGKFGFVVDTGQTPVLSGSSGDIRIERDHAGGLILAAEGCQRAKPLTAETAVDEAMALARWFENARGVHKRMAALLIQTDVPDGFDVSRQTQTYQPTPGQTAFGALFALSLGQMNAETLFDLAQLGPLRMTPWRMVLVEGVTTVPEIKGLITQPTDPLLRVVACTGVPGCAQGNAETKATARQLAPFVPADKTLHVSGCPKGCAHPGQADLALTAGQDGWAFATNARAVDADPKANLSSHDILQSLKAI